MTPTKHRRLAWVVASAVLVPSLASAGDHAPPAQVDGAPLELRAPMTVPAGEHRAMALADGVEVVVDGGSTVTLLDAQWFPPERGAKAIRAYRLIVKEGNVSVRVPEDAAAPRAFFVGTTTGESMLVWRGLVQVAAREGEAHAAVHGGATFVGSDSRWTVVHAGTGVVLRHGSPPDTQHPLLAGPAWSAGDGSGFALARGDEKVRVRSAWSAVTGAAAYRLEVADDEAMAKHLQVVDTASPEAETPALGSGTHFVRVRAMGKDGMPGVASTTRPIRVARWSLSTGAAVAADGTIIVPRGGAVSLEDARDLEVATAFGQDLRAVHRLADTAAFSGAPESLGLAGQPVRVFRVRHPKYGGEARFALVENQLRANITLGPKRARWPEDTLDVRARAVDPSGRLDTTTVSFEVRIDGRPEAVEWSRAPDGTWSTHIPPRVPPGPWLVSIVGKDSAGAEVGAAFLEVDGPRLANTARREADHTEVKVLRSSL